MIRAESPCTARPEALMCEICTVTPARSPISMASA
jgi:hypothetical protein